MNVMVSVGFEVKVFVAHMGKRTGRPGRERRGQQVRVSKVTVQCGGRQGQRLS